ncbi:MAG TPA: hypothetical protein VFS16_00340, partial [Acidimicrobiia bacterium]|nr:hypothetical protein [Acidimicrobiia bacterium]
MTDPVPDRPPPAHASVLRRDRLRSGPVSEPRSQPVALRTPGRAVGAAFLTLALLLAGCSSGGKRDAAKGPDATSGPSSGTPGSGTGGPAGAGDGADGAAGADGAPGAAGGGTGGPG